MRNGGGIWYLGGAEPPCPDATDADDSGQVDITDAIDILSYLFLGGVAPAAPGPLTCGVDCTPDLLGRCRSNCR